MAPLSYIPTELLEIILYESLPSLLPKLEDPTDIHPPFQDDPIEWKEDVSRSFQVTHEVDNARTNLRRVCRYWNAVILNSRKMWSRLEIQVDRFAQNRNMLWLLLKQSKGATLDIKLQFRKKGRYDGLESYGLRRRLIMEEEDAKLKASLSDLMRVDSQEEIEATEEEVQCVLDIIRSVFNRTRTLIIYYTNDEDQLKYTRQLFPSNTQTLFPRLKYLFTHVLEPARDTVPYLKDLGSLVAPNLQVCNICLAIASLWDSLASSEVTRLTTLNVTFHSGYFWDAQNLLARCQNLEQLSWSIPPWHEWVSHGRPPRLSVAMDFPFLTSLCLEISSDREPCLDLFNQAADCLHMPRLRSLTLGGTRDTDLQWVHRLLAKNPHIELLRLSAFRIKHQTGNSLAPLVALRALVLSLMKPTSQFLQAIFLSPGHKNTRLLPSLSTFVIERPQQGWAVSKTMIRIIEQWTRPECPAPVEFHIWSHAHLFVGEEITRGEGCECHSENIGGRFNFLPKSLPQFELNYWALLELAYRSPDLVYVYDLELKNDFCKWDTADRMEVFVRT